MGSGQSSNKELLYVIGALLGDGCIYKWRNEHQIWLIGDKQFVNKYSNKLSVIIGRKVKFYQKRKRNFWYCKISNIKLFNLFQEIRKDHNKILTVIENDHDNSLNFIEGFFDAEGCVKVIKEPIRKTPKICLDITNTNYELLEIIQNLLKDSLKIESRYSNQRAFVGKDGFSRKKTYHLRIYKKEHIKDFLKNVNTTKLKPEKIRYVNNWLNNGK